MENVKPLLTSFADSTTAHGYSRLLKANTLAHRCFWTFILLGAAGGLTYHFGHLLMEFFKYEKATNIHEGLEPVVFPQIILCSTKLWSDLAVQQESTGYFQTLRDELVNYSEPYMANISLNKRNRFASEVLKESLASGLLARLNESIVHKDNMLIYCRFFNKVCGPENFTFMPYGLYGACYRFNAPDVPNLKTSFHKGLQLLMYVEDTLWNELLEHVVTTKGVLVYAIPQGVNINFNREVPLGAPTGYLTNIGFSVTKFERHPTPNDPCLLETEVWDPYEKHSNHFNYTYSDCVDQQITRRLLKSCGCISTQMSIPLDMKDVKHCLDVALDNTGRNITNVRQLVRNYLCETEALEHLERATENERKVCLKACHRRKIQREVSSVAIPEEPRMLSVYLNDVIEANASSRLPEKLRTMHYLLNESGTGFRSPWVVKQNLLQLNLFIRTAEVMTYIEARSYPFVSFVSEAGGVLGLWVGASVVTITEVMQLIGLFLLKFLGGKKNKVETIIVQSQDDKSAVTKTPETTLTWHS